MGAVQFNDVDLLREILEEAHATGSYSVEYQARSLRIATDRGKGTQSSINPIAHSLLQTEVRVLIVVPKEKHS